ncbi:hypothetical protein I302_104491 [Kwoniella bestiolae CBS 10118]|uniref:N-acetyltransferase domain-containing protein n=1 Tax=Kwoniella bestiolae CBS 10118 TaxID=1296100 RepID=A0A1B9GBD6_9TREE|nr:hypothetical protein I302_03197 [Kwoniella bestiolae CBS 10118]OCF28338.1 hypothetical protein I302_03197 [Kwoniella bestiolae CBS 10118]
MFDPKEFTIRIASAKQAEEHAKACFEIPYWRVGMSFEQFLEFGYKESQASWAKDNGMLTWVLVRKDDYDGQVYSLLETHRKKGFVKPKNGGQVENGYWYNITAVVTPIRHRGNGYATHLLRLLHYVLLSPSSPGNPPSHIPPFPRHEWGTPPPAVPSDLIEAIPSPCASVLWSDVPTQFYEGCTIGLTGKGYEYRKEWNSRLVFDLDLSGPDMDENSSNGDGWEMIYQKDLEEITSILTSSTKTHLSKLDTSSKPLWTHDPSTAGSLTFIGTRGSFIIPSPRWKDPSRELPLGVRLRPRDGEKGGDIIILIALENFLVEQRLLLTYIHNLLPARVPSLLKMLESVVKETGAPWTQGEIWGFNPADEWVAALAKENGRGVKIDTRDGIRSHVLGVCNYLEGEGEMVDHQMWSWV